MENKIYETSTNSTQINRPEIGKWEYFTIYPVFNNGYQPDPLGSSGHYKVEFVLGISKYSIDQFEISNHQDREGDSFIQFKNPSIDDFPQVNEVQLEMEGNNKYQAEARITCNKHGRLSKIIFNNFEANSLAEAENNAYQLVSPYISWISFQYNVPVEIIQTNIIELSTKIQSINLWMSPQIKGFDNKFEIPRIPYNSLILECIGQYREGINITNIFYSFLCFWKSYEGISHIRRKLDKYIRKNGIENTPKRTDKIIDSTETQNHCPNFIGKKLGNVYETFKKTKRDAIAHLDTSTGTFLSPHSLREIKEVRQATQAMRYVAKVAIKNEISIYEYLIKNGHTNVL